MKFFKRDVAIAVRIESFYDCNHFLHLEINIERFKRALQIVLVQVAVT